MTTPDQDGRPRPAETHRDWTGPVAFVLSLGVSIALAVTLIAIALDPKPIDAAYSSVITTLAASTVGALGAYLGFGKAARPPTSPPDNSPAPPKE
jgi:hypothetical protein